MKSHNVCILGSGISGLSLAYFLKKQAPKLNITVLEKQQTPGGVIGQKQVGKALFYTGPKTFKVSRSEPLLDLIYDLKLESQIQLSGKDSEKRFLYYKNKIHPIPTSLAGFFLSSLTRKAIFPLIKESQIRPMQIEDESIGSFVRRRFGNYIADVFFDPLTTGIYATDMHRLSVNTCFPYLQKGEKNYGSVVKALLKNKNKKTHLKYNYPQKSLLTLKKGLYSLIKRLSQVLKDEIIYNQEIVKIERKKQGYQIFSKDQVYQADAVFSALPLQVLKSLDKPFTYAQKFLLEDFKSSSLLSVHLQYEKNVLPLKGFGYLVPSKEKQTILGVVFDSTLFPSSEDKTTLTVMMGGSFHPEYLDLEDSVILDMALGALQNHLKLTNVPESYFIQRYPFAIPQFPLYHRNKIEKLEKELEHDLPSFFLAGNFLGQGSVSSCIQTSQKLAYKYLKACATH